MALEVGERVGISVRETSLRSTAGFLSRTTATLSYLDEVVVQSIQGDWLQVKVADTGATGWIHSSSVAGTSELQLSGSRSERGGASNREIALAGRGFNEQVEEQIKTDQDLDFTIVDEMETFILAPDETVEFLVAAGLAPDTGGEE